MRSIPIRQNSVQAQPQAERVYFVKLFLVLFSHKIKLFLCGIRETVALSWSAKKNEEKKIEPTEIQTQAERRKRYLLL
jgi:hypothetical protein